MNVITTVSAMQAWSENQRRNGQRVGLVPTMGYLHAGHARLITECRTHADRTIVSIFVNPLQFGPSEDLERYPRDLDRDQKTAGEAGADVVFHPGVTEMYPDGFQTHVEVERASRGLCGPFRPGHFRGVTTVVAKLFNMTRPHVALFGEKDFQQLAVIRRMARDLDFDIEIIGVPTVREADGLALSSRNVYLSPSERRAAQCIPQALAAARALAESAERDGLRILAAARRVLSAETAARIEYVTLSDPESIEEVARVDRPTLLALAVWIGKTRLIDNCILTPPSAAANREGHEPATREPPSPRGGA